MATYKILKNNRVIFETTNFNIVSDKMNEFIKNSSKKDTFSMDIDDYNISTGRT